MAAVFAFAGFLTTVVTSALVTYYCGDAPGIRHAAPVLMLLLATCMAAGTARKPMWPAAPRWQGALTGVLCVAAAAVAVLDGGAYMGSRFSTGERDLTGRIAHWQLGRDMLRTPSDWLLGKGLGRFPANHFLVGDPSQHPGDYRIKKQGENAYLTLAGGMYVNGWGELFRVTQRVAPPGDMAVVTAVVRTKADVALHFEVCEKQLLYNLGCLTKTVTVKGAESVWQPIRVELRGDRITRGEWYAPRLIAFSVAVESIGGLVDLDQLQLTSADGRPLLSNGDFSHEMAHWFFTSDKFHLPWHIKNMFMNVLFDQGAVGLALWSLLVAGALWHTTKGAARLHPLAPATAAGLIGFITVGLFDSLLDVPRLACLFYLLTLVALTLKPPTRLLKNGGNRKVVGTLTLAAACFISLQPEQVQAQTPFGKAKAAQPILRVGPLQFIKTLAEAAKVAPSGVVVEVDAGEYVGDVSIWTQDRLTLRTVGGRVKLIAAGAAAEGKAIWVMRGGQISVEGFDFSGARVPDRNGAGIRLEQGALTVRNCTFTQNENGILTSNNAKVQLEIVNSEFSHNGAGDGQSHNLYVGQIASLSVTGSYFHHANVGHLLKSRAALNDIRYNRLTDEPGGRASYELEFANGGVAYVVGNIIQQGHQTENPHLISYGTEGYTQTKNELYLINNTLVDDREQGGVFLRVKPGDVVVKALNNLLVGKGVFDSAALGDYRNNVTVSWDTFEFAARQDYRLKRGEKFAEKMLAPGSANGVSLQQKAQYAHPLRTLALPGEPHNPGALQP